MCITQFLSRSSVKRASFALLLLTLLIPLDLFSHHLQPLGNNQPVALIVTRYQGTESPSYTSPIWSDALNDRLNDFYAAATAGQTTFNFIPISPTVTLPYTYQETTPPNFAGFDLVDDPMVVLREAHDAIDAVLNANPNALNGIGRVIVILNRPKRARSMSEFPFLYQSASHPVVLASACVVIDPFASNYQNLDTNPIPLTPTDTDTDGDGLLDVDEEAIGASVTNPDTDGDRIPDGTEVLNGTSPLLADTDGDGFRDIEETFSGTDPLLGEDLPILPDSVITLSAHELAHQLGLGDLYRLDFGGTPEPYESWDIMAFDNLQNFSAFSRSEMGWVQPNAGLFNLEIPAQGLAPFIFILYPPALSRPDSLEVIRLKRDHFSDLLIENRSLLDLDFNRPGVPRGRYGLPLTYRPGILLSETDHRYKTQNLLLRFVTGSPISKIIPNLSGDDCTPETGLISRLQGTVQGPATLEWDLSVRPDTDDFLEIRLDGITLDLFQETVDAMGQFTTIHTPTPYLIPEGIHELTITHQSPPGSYGGDVFLENIELRHAPLIVGHPMDATVLFGDTHTFSVFLAQASQAGASFQWERELGSGWTPLPGANQSSLSLNAFSVQQQGRYRVIVSNSGGAVASNPAMLTFWPTSSYPLAAILEAPGQEFTSSSVEYPWIPTANQFGVQSSPSIPSQIPTSLTTPIEGPATLNLLWYQSNTSASFECFLDDQSIAVHPTNGVHPLSLVIPEGTHVVRWTFTRGPILANGTLSNWNLQKPPALLRPIDPQNLRPGDDLSLRVTLASSTPQAYTYRWFQNNTLIATTQNDSLLLSNAQPEQSGQYHVEITTPWNVITHPPATIKIWDPQQNPVQAVLDTPQASWTTEGCFSSWILYQNNHLRSLFPRTPFYAAAMLPGDAYSDPYGLSIQALPLSEVADPEDHPEGSLAVEIQSAPPPGVADLNVVGGWLDSPANGFGTFLFGTGGFFGDPNLQGDAVSLRLTTSTDWSVFPPAISVTTSPMTHRVEFRVRNTGTTPAFNVSGAFYILPLSLPIGLNLNSRVVLEQIASEVFPISLGDMETNSTQVVRQTVTPSGPFQAALLLDPAPNEPNTANNVNLATFLTVLPSFGSPYKPIEAPLNITNLNPRGHLVFPNILGLPNDWSYDSLDPQTLLRKSESFVSPDGQAQFQVRIQAPDPQKAPQYKPGTVGEINVQGWMNLGDEFVPFGEIPVVFALTHPTRLILELKNSPPNAILTGSLRYRAVDGATFNIALPNTPLEITINGSDGSQVAVPIVTDNQGNFEEIFPYSAQVGYTAIARFHGATAYGISDSQPATWNQPTKNSLLTLQLDSAKISENEKVGALIGNFFVPNSNPKLKLDFVSGFGSDDNKLFALENQQLLSQASFDFEENPIRSMRVRATDLDTDTTYESAFLIQILDDRREDSDRDGLLQDHEHRLGTSDFLVDSDGDGAADPVEADLGTDPATSQDHPISTWQILRGIRAPTPLSAHYSTRNEIIFAHAQSERDAGIYTISQTSSVERLVSLDQIAALALDPDNQIFASRLTPPYLVRVSRSNPVPTDWASTLTSQTERPLGIAFPSSPRLLPPLTPKEGLLVANDRNQTTPLPFSLDKASPSLEPLDSLKPFRGQGTDLTIADGQIFLVTATTAESESKLLRLLPNLQWSEIPLDTRLVDAQGIAYSHTTQRLYVTDRRSRASVLLEIHPFTGATRTLYQSLSPDIQPAGIDIDHTGRFMVLTDTGRDSILELGLTYGLPPLLETLQPEITLPNGEIKMTGKHFASITSIRLANQSLTDYTLESDNSILLSLPPSAQSGYLELTSPYGAATSPIPLQILPPLQPFALSQNTLAENLPEFTAIGQFLYPSATHPLQFQLTPDSPLPDNRFFEVQGGWLHTASSFDFERKNRYLINVTASDPFGQTRDTSFQIDILDRPEILAQPQSLSVSPGSQQHLLIQMLESRDLEFQWFFDERPIPGQTEARLLFDPITPNDEGTYQVFVSNPLETIGSRKAVVRLEAETPNLRIARVQALSPTRLRVLVEASSPTLILLEQRFDWSLEGWEPLDQTTTPQTQAQFDLAISPELSTWFLRARTP